MIILKKIFFAHVDIDSPVSAPMLLVFTVSTMLIVFHGAVDNWITIIECV